MKRAEDYKFSSAYAHVYKKKDILLEDNFMTGEIKDWKAYLSEWDNEEDRKLFHKHERIGRPLGEDKFIKKLENITGRILTPMKPEPKKR